MKTMQDAKDEDHNTDGLTVTVDRNGKRHYGMICEPGKFASVDPADKVDVDTQKTEA